MPSFIENNTAPAAQSAVNVKLNNPHYPHYATVDALFKRMKQVKSILKYCVYSKDFKKKNILYEYKSKAYILHFYENNASLLILLMHILFFFYLFLNVTYGGRRYIYFEP